MNVKITEKDIHALFNPFLPRKFNSRSLGFPAVLIVRAHLGAITVESKAERGSIFRVFLPVLVEGAAQPTALLAETRETREGGTNLEFHQVFLEKTYGVTALREAIRQALKVDVFSNYPGDEHTQPKEVVME